VKTFCSVGEADLGHKRLQQHGSFGYFDSTDKWEQTVSEALETKDAMGAN
jgi:aromatic ring-opening dioxygenase LigB subunit